MEEYGDDLGDPGWSVSCLKVTTADPYLDIYLNIYLGT